MINLLCFKSNERVFICCNLKFDSSFISSDEIRLSLLYVCKILFDINVSKLYTSR